MQRRRTETLPVLPVSRSPLWDECHKCSALACSRRCKHWTHPTRDRRVKPRNRRTAPHSCGRFSASALDPKTEKDMHESRPPSLAKQACRPKKCIGPTQRSSQWSVCIPTQTHTQACYQAVTHRRSSIASSICTSAGEGPSSRC